MKRHRFCSQWAVVLLLRPKTWESHPSPSPLLSKEDRDSSSIPNFHQRLSELPRNSSSLLTLHTLLPQHLQRTMGCVPSPTKQISIIQITTPMPSPGRHILAAFPRSLDQVYISRNLIWLSPTTKIFLLITQARCGAKARERSGEEREKGTKGLGSEGACFL